MWIRSLIKHEPANQPFYHFENVPIVLEQLWLGLDFIEKPLMVFEQIR